MNTDQSTEKKALENEAVSVSNKASEAVQASEAVSVSNKASEAIPEHPLINVIMRQTDYSKDVAIEKLKQHNNNVIEVVREYMNPPIQELKNTKSTSQLIYGEIRSLMGSAATNYRMKKETEERRQQMQAYAISQAKALYEKQEAIKEQQIQNHKNQQQLLREKAAAQKAAQQASQKESSESLTSTL